MLLNASGRGITYWMINLQPMVEVRNTHRDITDEIVYSHHVIVVDVLRLVRHLVIVRLLSGSEERYRNAVARIIVVVASAVDALGVSVGIVLVIEFERPRALRV